MASTRMPCPSCSMHCARGGDIDVTHSGMQLVAQALIELEATQAIGAGRYERSAERMTHRNGARERLLSTKAGDLELRILKPRQ